jgi:hypothetical protein
VDPWVERRVKSMLPSGQRPLLNIHRTEPVVIEPYPTDPEDLSAPEPGRKLRQHPSHRGVAVDQPVLFLHDYLPELKPGSDVLQPERRPLHRQLKLSGGVWNPLRPSRSHMHLIPLLRQPCNVGQVTIQKVLVYIGNKQDLRQCSFYSTKRLSTNFHLSTNFRKFFHKLSQTNR